MPACDGDRERAQQEGSVDRSVGEAGDPHRAAVVRVQLKPGNVDGRNEESAATGGASRRPKEAGGVINIGRDGVPRRLLKRVKQGVVNYAPQKDDGCPSHPYAAPQGARLAVVQIGSRQRAAQAE